MKQKIISLCVATLMAAAHGYAGVTLTVPDVNIAQGGTAYVVINFDLGTPPYTAYQFDIAWPEGISAVNDADGNPAFTKGDVYHANHSVSSTYTTGGLSRFQCFSVNSDPFTAQSGTLLIMPVKAQKTLAEGTYQATISPIEFVQTDATPDRPEAVTFNIVVSQRVTLDETSTVAPEAATNVNVLVKRTINADEWSTICLPFAMTAEQCKAAFGNDVQIADFTGCEATFDSHEDVTAINVKFADAASIEANHPYIIKVSTAVSEFAVDGVDVAPSEELSVDRDEYSYKRNGKTYYEYNSFVGNYVAGTTVPENCLFISGNEFWYSTGLTQIKAFRGFFSFYYLLSEVADASRLHIVFNGSDATAVKQIGNSKPADSQYYDLQGRRVMKPARGIYVKDGKKKVIR